jgi:hypothetical protein
MTKFSTTVATTLQSIHDCFRPGWIHRGQRESEWELETSLFRCCNREGFSGKQCTELERRLFRQFRRSYHYYSEYIPETHDQLQWYSLMRHHEAPTRLLDFTYSIYVALYFAIENTTTYAAVWSINLNWALEESINLLRAAGKDRPERLRHRYVEEDMKEVPELLFEPDFVKCACPQNPFHLNERLRVQKGLFMIPGDTSVPFSENLKAMPGWDNECNVVKIVVPAESRRQILEGLFEMNISRTSLFPGLDGYTASLGVYDPDYRNIE